MLSIKKIPPKLTLKETLVRVQRYNRQSCYDTIILDTNRFALSHMENLQHLQSRDNEELIIKKQTLLMEKFKAELWDREEYRKIVTALESDKVAKAM